MFAEVGSLNPDRQQRGLVQHAARLHAPGHLEHPVGDTTFPLTGFKSLRDQTITAAQGVHGVRETFQYTFPTGQSDTFDEDSLTNADQTVVYYLLVHCTNACYTQNQNAINTVMTSFTIGSRT